GEHNRVTRVLEVRDQVTRALHRLDLFDQREIQRLLGGAYVVALLPLHLVAGKGADELVAAHAEVTVDPPDRQHEVVLSERPVPRDRVVVVRVHEGAVDVEDRYRHGGDPTPPSRVRGSAR